ncbi:ParA family protein [Curtobacterium sp. MCPF17_021]|uniref:ParA family protein n=1 Tax=Curtobacterium sp. MCPF17_021 TaxID=2175639 RepID=UPI0021ABD70A|nr:ParA family protein [Curtobacterium sp. MCPF17_021]WIE85119.1 ParA family protein [Curtobacterium sp. MCPF17_021]
MTERMHAGMLSCMQTVMVYSESGGVSKTTTAVSIAMIAAERGLRTLLVDLDPRAASTKWLDVEPSGEGLHVGAILGNEEPEGWAEDLAVSTAWSPNLRVLPSARNVSNREADRADHAELRLRMSLEGVQADLVVIDCPNRQGGPLTLAALNAADTVVYAATATNDGVDGFNGARKTVQQFRHSRERIGAPVTLTEAGIVVGGVRETIMSRPAVASIDELRETGMLLVPLVPERAIVQEVRLTGEWYGNYRKGAPVLDAYTAIVDQVIR